MGRKTFSLLLSGVAEITPDLADALYSATSGDIEFTAPDGVARLGFERSSLRRAITAAIREVEGAEAGVRVVRVVRVESEAAKIIAKINADLLEVAGGKFRSQTDSPRSIIAP